MECKDTGRQKPYPYAVYCSKTKKKIGDRKLQMWYAEAK